MDSNKCDSEIYEKGEVIFVTNTIRSFRMEEWCKAIAEDSGQPVDWHQYAGRCVMKALGDLDKVRKSIIHLKKMHNDFVKEALQGLLFKDEEFCLDCIRSIWNYNYKHYDL